MSAMLDGDHAANSAFAPSPASAAEIASIVAPVVRSHEATVTVRANAGQAANAANVIAKTAPPLFEEVLRQFKTIIFICLFLLS